MAQLHVNGTLREVDASGDTPLLWALREQLGLTGTKYGCGIAQCGACTVHVDGVATRSCVRPISTLSASEKIVTIEGLSPDGSHPLQRAWVELDVPQCGYCQAGQLMQAASLLARNPKPTTEQVTQAMAGNICRCATYPRIRSAVLRAAELTAAGGGRKKA